MSTPTLPNLHLGTTPDSWGVWFPDDPKQVPWHRFLDEAAGAGYTARRRQRRHRSLPRAHRPRHSVAVPRHRPRRLRRRRQPPT